MPPIAPRRKPVASVLIVLLLAGLVEAAPPRMTFRNNLLPGHLTRHHLTRTTRRITQKPEFKETFVYRQQGELTQVNIEEAQPGNVLVYQMIDDGPAKAVSLFRGAERIKKIPNATKLNLPKGSTRLHSATRTARDAPAQVPLSDSAQRVVMEALLDFAHWPREKLDAGHRWERTLNLDGFEGKQTFEFVDLVRVREDVTARVTMFVEGTFTGPLERDYEFEKGQAILHWSRPERTLVRLEAQATYRRKRQDGEESFRLKLDADLTHVDMLDEDAQEEVRVQLTAFAGALEQSRRGHPREVVQICREYRGRWPRSMWEPAIRELEDQATARYAGAGRLTSKQIRQALSSGILAWEAAWQSREYDVLETSERAFSELAEEYRDKLIRLAQGKDDAPRSQAMFALAFSVRPDDLAIVQKAAADKSVRVRRMALAGLAASRARHVSVETLIAALGDENVGVRRRACQAVAACVPPEHYSIVTVVDKINHLMIFDEADAVRRAAVQALAAVGAPADVPKLKKALSHELNQEIRREIENAIDILESKS
jgi:hypothetical protein